MDGFDFTTNPDALFDFASSGPAASVASFVQPVPAWIDLDDVHSAAVQHRMPQYHLNAARAQQQQQQSHPQQQPLQHQHQHHQQSQPQHHQSQNIHSQQQHLQHPPQASQAPQADQEDHNSSRQTQTVHNHAHRPSSRPGSNASHQPLPLHSSALDLEYANVFGGAWQYQVPHPQMRQQSHLEQQQINHPAVYPPATMGVSFRPLQPSPVEFMPAATADSYAIAAGTDGPSFVSMARHMGSMQSLAYPLADYPRDVPFPMALNTAALTQHLLNLQAHESSRSSAASTSPPGTVIEVQSVSDNEWSVINVNPNRNSSDSFGTVSNPSQNLHIRSNSDSSSDGVGSSGLSGSYEEISPWLTHSPHDLHGSDYLDAQYIQQQTRGLPGPSRHQNSPSSTAVSPSAPAAPSYRSSGSSGSSSTSPTSSGPLSPPLRRRKNPVDGKTTKPTIKKPAPARKDSVGGQKKVGRRRGPLRPDQRQQAHEIRKMRACLRCKFLKKTCDKGEPCAGCRPSHARLWQVPCTRMDIKDIAFFMKDWKADYERHVSLGFSVGNIRGFSNIEHTMYITHGYGHYLPIAVREVFVRDDKCFGIDWVESIHVEPREFEVNTAKLSAGIEGVSVAKLSEYLDRHLDRTFESFVDEFFEGTFFLTEILKTAHRYYLKEKTPAIRKALKLVLAYNLTQHVTMVEMPPEEEGFIGRIERGSRFAGMAVAPVMINFQVKCALADMWRELQKDILEELSALYSSVYSGDKLKHWPTIFMLAAILLAIWEEMQFDCHYRVLDENAVNKFCDDMETTPVGVIVGLFQAISTKLPGLQEWDSRKHHHLLGSNPAVCDALTEVKGHIDKYEKYLRERSSATFDRNDFECLSNKFLSKLVIRAN